MESEVKIVVLRPRCFCLLPSFYRANRRTVKDIQRNSVSGGKKDKGEVDYKEYSFWRRNKELER